MRFAVTSPSIRFFALGAVVVLALIALALIPPKNTIVLRADGFHPRTLTIAQGETVRFVSERGKYFWPASDFHPSHTLYPAFDPKKPIPPHESWSFTFTEPGVYKFHDHLAAYYFGVIKVLDAEGKVVDRCKEKGGDFECWQNNVFLALSEHGVDAAYDTVSKLYTEEPGFVTSCHSITHNIGLASYQFFLRDTNFIYSPKATACAAGFYHGFMEGYLGALGDAKKAGALCDEIGKRIGKESPDARLQCYHGIGHGAVETAIASSGSLGNAQDFIRSALAICTEASTGVDERYRCASGLYNGIANFYISGLYGFSVEKYDPLRLCAEQPETYKDSCYGNMNSVVLWHAHNDIDAAIKTLNRIPEPQYLTTALSYLVNLSVVNHLADDSVAPLITTCHRLTGDMRSTCLAAVARGLLEHGAPGIEYRKALLFCREPSLTNSEREACRRVVITGAPGWYGPETIAKLCNEATSEERAYCPK